MEVSWEMTPFAYILLGMSVIALIGIYFVARHKGFIGDKK